MTIQEIMTNPNCWQDSEVVVYYKTSFIGDKETYQLCSDDEGFYLLNHDGTTIREFEELGDMDVDRLQISIVY